MRVFLLRHAETAWSLSGQDTGRTDLELTQAGRAEAARASAIFERLLEGQELDAIYASPRRRALQTAELVLPGRTPVISELVQEFDYGDYEGLTPAQIQSRAPGWSLWQDGCPNGETVGDVGARADAFIQGVLAQHEGGRVCVVSHGHMTRVLTARMLGLAPALGGIFEIKTSSVAELVRKNAGFALTRWNLTA
jgi:broad specificity phosphatase PhoE